ncbi:DUF3311 domain-containing protein [Streptomyces monomycini]|uniref:DUF3311 domain-containing protein n=1 Tax=Streptomyces monomycini TaxID=371720 RepID=UPI0004A9FEE3|nr:DUF3311 domain-containing protein [Streptomyces monomycini]
MLKRPTLLWLLVPHVLYLGVLPLVNRVTPTVLGLPFLVFWMLLATLLTPASVWLAWRGDRKRAARRAAGRAGAPAGKRAGEGSAA